MCGGLDTHYVQHIPLTSLTLPIDLQKKQSYSSMISPLFNVVCIFNCTILEILNTLCKAYFRYFPVAHVVISQFPLYISARLIATISSLLEVSNGIALTLNPATYLHSSTQSQNTQRDETIFLCDLQLTNSIFISASIVGLGN